MLLVSCSTTSGDKKYKCVLDLVREGVDADKAAKACKYTYKNMDYEIGPIRGRD
jgi:hypothetical protein